ncbi:MAG: 23S rRNA (pseudouridine(1915)-N(3))-methyltransferase RlmH [SAR324 cluster bacterium]|nr:23S rRNA (pseudouridine(1915)-N(3))-methyltransferase RlmH [SAR324 cluster bacterium]
MYQVQFIWVGKTQEVYLRTGIDNYLSKIKHYVSVECLEIKPANYSQGNQALWRKKETQTILKKIVPSESIIVLDEQGDQKSSLQLAQKLEQLKETEYKQVNFVIGGAFGLDLPLFKRASFLSLSSMTYTHQMVRLLLLEQVYRAFTIINKESYHH